MLVKICVEPLSCRYANGRINSSNEMSVSLELLGACYHNPKVVVGLFLNDTLDHQYNFRLSPISLGLKREWMPWMTTNSKS
jgi:hypothetical protein